MSVATVERVPDARPAAGPVRIVVRPPETDEQKADRLEREIAACIRNHALLRKGTPQVYRNNERLRSGIRQLVETIETDDDLAPLVEKLKDALLIPFAYERPQPDDVVIEESPAPGDLGERIAFLQERLRVLGRANYLVQEAAAPVVWNSDAIRGVMGELIRELDPPIDDDETLPATLDMALIASIVDDLKATLKAASDKPDK
jgi:hypothetical protein